MTIQENKYQDALNNIENKLNKNNANSEQEKKVIGFNKNSTSTQKKEIVNHDLKVEEDKKDIPEVEKEPEELQLEKKEKQHKYRLKDMELENQIKIDEDNKKTELKLNRLKNKVSKLEIKRTLGLIWGGRFVSFFALMLIITTTAMTIGGQTPNFIGETIIRSDNTRVFQLYSLFIVVPFLLFAIFTQAIIYVSCVFKTTIDSRFYRLSTPIMFIRNLVLIFSIYSNYKFFESRIDNLRIDSIEGIMVLLICILIDSSSVIFTTLGQDMKTLNYHGNIVIRSINFFVKLWKILTNPLTKWVDQKFNNIEEPNETNDNRTSKKQNPKSTGKTSAKDKNDSIENSTTRNENNNNSNNTTARHTQTTNNATNNTSDRYYKKIRNYINRLKAKNIETVDVELLKEKCNVSAPIWRKVRDQLVDENILNFSGRITKIIL